MNVNASGFWRFCRDYVFSVATLLLAAVLIELFISVFGVDRAVFFPFAPILFIPLTFVSYFTGIPTMIVKELSRLTNNSLIFLLGAVVMVGIVSVIFQLFDSQVRSSMNNHLLTIVLSSIIVSIYSSSVKMFNVFLED